jgi:hypothetical protein
MTLTYTEIIGLIFLLIATFNFGFIVYWFDDKLIKKEDEISDIEKNNQNKLNEFNVNIKAIAAWNNSLVETIKILKSILSISPSNEFIVEKIEKTQSLKKQLDLDYLFQMHLMTKKKMPSDELKNIWSSMSFADAQNEKMKYDKDFADMLNNNLATLKNHKQHVNKLRHKKLVLIFWSVVFQIMGLALTFIKF